MAIFEHKRLLATMLVLSCFAPLLPGPATGNVGKVKLSSSSASASPTPTSPAVPASFTFNGAGFGHGVGLSQYGAQGMAKEGYTSQQIVQHYYPGALVTPRAMPTDLVVGLLQDRSVGSRRFVALRTEGVGGTGNPMTISIGTTKLTISEKTNITVGVANNKVVVYGKNGIYVDNNGKYLTADSISVSWGKQKQGTKVATVINIASSDSSAQAISNLGGYCSSKSCNHRYKYGSLTIKPYTSSALNVANTLALDDEYLYGLGEVPSSWEPSALEAQVIAARAYAFSKYSNNKTLRSPCACQIYGTPSDQNFVGFTKEISTGGARWVAAVKATAKKVVVYKGRVIQAFFSSSTGGYSQPVSEVWGSSGFPWLTKVDDHWSKESSNPNSSWKQTITQATLVSKLRKLHINVKDVASFVVSNHYPSGGVSELSIADSAGRITVITSIPTLLRPAQPNLSPEGVRSVFGLKSSYIRSITASATSVAGAKDNKPDVLAQLTINQWPAAKQYPLSTIALSGNVVPKQLGVKVVLADQQSKTWKTIATTTTDMDGVWNLTWPQVPSGSHTLRVTAINAVSSVRAISPAIAIEGQLTLNAPKKIRPSGIVTLSGDIRPMTTAVAIQIQRRTATTPWKTIGRTFTDIAGHYICKTKVGKRKATFLYRVIARDPSLGNMVSTAVTVQVK